MPPPPPSRLRSVGSAAMRSQVRRVLRGAAAHVGPLERLLQRVAEQSEQLDHLRRRLDKQNRLLDEKRRALKQLDSARTYADFFGTLAVDGDVARPAVTLTRQLMSRPGGKSEARSIAQVLQQYEGLRPIAELCLALCAVAEPMPELAWTLFTRTDPALVVRWAAEEYFRLGFQRDPDTAAASLARVLNGELPLQPDPHVWLEIARSAFAADATELAERALRRAEDALPHISDANLAAQLRARTENLRDWLGRAVWSPEGIDHPDGEIAFALVGYGHPDRAAMSTDLADFTDTLAILGQLVRHENVRFVGDPELVELAGRLRGEVTPERRIAGSAATVRLYEVDRDASRYAAVPENTWIVVSDWFARPVADGHVDMPLAPGLRPLFISFHITPVELAAPDVVDYLRDHGPIGCRDWDTVFLLHAAGIPAFFSGAIAMTLDTVIASRPAAAVGGTVFVGVAPDGAGEQQDRRLHGAKARSLGENLTAALADLVRYRDAGSRVVTTDVRLHLALRALGGVTELRLVAPDDYRALDFVDLTDDGFASLQCGISAKLAAVLAAVVDGRPDKEVYETWREACEPDVAAASAELARYPDRPQLDFDLAEVCAAIRATTVVSERTEPGPEGHEINVEFSVDGNYKHQLDVVLDSIVQRASRPVRAFVLCRGYGADDFERMAHLFPTVSFVWLQTDRVDYGNVRGKIKWATIVTMDRTILPQLLPDVDRIIHFDLDALCLGDLAELFDVDLEGTWIAAVDEPQPAFAHGFASLRDSASLLRREGLPDLAREYLIRTHSELAFDFEIFNAGIMVLDLAAMRAGDFTGRFLSYVPRFGINGQRILNVGVGRDRKKVDPEWNRLLRLEADESAKVAHWAGPVKPWAGHRFVPGRQLWRDQERAFAERVERSTGSNRA